MTHILLLCTANICRSVMAQALLTRRIAAAGLDMTVDSAGLATVIDTGRPPPAEVIEALARYGLDASRHRSRRVGGQDLAGSDLVLTMTRDQLRAVVVADPAIWPRAFTLKELVRLGYERGHQPAGLSMADWLTIMHQGRYRTQLLGDSPADDVIDPIGGPPEAYAATATQLDDLLARLVAFARR